MLAPVNDMSFLRLSKFPSCFKLSQKPISVKEFRGRGTLYIVIILLEKESVGDENITCSRRSNSALP
jgi:hypothetical protein